MLVVLPAWNEAASLPAVLNEIHAHLPDVGVVVVNDGSADATSAVARAHGAQVLDLPFNIGVGGAMRAGFRFAPPTTSTRSSRSMRTGSTIRATSRRSSRSWLTPTS